MIESLVPRPTAPSGSTAVVPPITGEKIVHRPQTRVSTVEAVDRNAQTGPRPAFRHTYLERAAALWPEEPVPPVTDPEYTAPEVETEQNAVAGDIAVLRQDPSAATSTVDVRW